MSDIKNESFHREEFESHLLPNRGIYVVQTGVKRMSRHFLDTGKTRVDFYEFGDFISVTVWLRSVNKLWTIDPTDGEARHLGSPGAHLMSEPTLTDPDEVGDEPIVTWCPTGQSSVRGMVCNTYRRYLLGVEAPCVRYVSVDTGFLVQEDELSPNGGVREVTEWKIELLGPPPAETFIIEKIQQELRDQVQRRKETRESKKCRRS